jgi:sugar-specific transcriptional regulator TrmB
MMGVTGGTMTYGIRKKDVTRHRDDKGTLVRNTEFPKFSQERPDLDQAKEHRPLLKGKLEASINDVRSIWPKIVEYTGLSEYESKVYLSLVSLGNAGARKLSLHCDVPRTKVYGTLKKLIDYGLVVEIPGSPKSFAPSHPNEAFDTVLNLTKKKAADFDTVVQNLIKTHEKHKEENGPQRKLVWYLDLDDDITGKCCEIIRQSVDELVILTTGDGLGVLFNSAHRLLDEVQEEGVEVKLYSPLDVKHNSLARELSYIFQVKQIEIDTPVLFINSDNKRFLLAKLNAQGAENPFESAIFSDDITLLQLVSLLLIEGKRNTLLKTLML